jgi:molecular chaperone GrpE
LKATLKLAFHFHSLATVFLKTLNRRKMSQDQENQAQTTENLEPQKIESEEKIAELEAKNSDLNDKLLRCLAELDNVRRRAREELEKTAKFALSNFASELVVVVENFLLASANAPKEEIEKNPAIKQYADAIVMTEKELLKVLEKNQIERIYPLGEKFDHNFHEAIAQVESEAEEGSVVSVIQSGYAISKRLIRPALVGVAKKSAA